MGKSSPYRDNAYAVVIGINQYDDKSIPDLKFARADAEAIYDVLSHPELGRISPDNIILLLDEKATQRKIRSAIGTKIPRRAGENDVVYIYFAGHGAPVIDPRSGSKDGMEKYLVPVDAELEDLRASGISMEEIKKFFSWIDSKQVIFFIDSCYSGGVGGRTFQNPHFQTRAALTSEFLDDLASEGRVVISACDVNEVSLEISNMNHGLFTHYLLEGLRGHGDKDQDGLVTVDELYEYVYDNVSRHARKYGGSMRPVRKGSVTGKIYLTRYESEQQRKARQLKARAETANRNGNFAKALQLWRDVQGLDPDHEKAGEEITRLKLVLRDQEQKAIQDLEQGKKVLFRLFQDGQLPANDFNQAMTILQKDTGQLTGPERRTRGLLIHLIRGNFSATTYLDSIAFLRDFSENDHRQQADSQEVTGSEQELPAEEKKQSQQESIATHAVETTPQPEPPGAPVPPGSEKDMNASSCAGDSGEQIPRVSLPSEPAILSRQKQKKMLVEYGFYDRYRNPHSRGFANQFEADSAGQVICDNTSQLMWQQSGSQKDMEYEQAGAYIDRLNREKFAGFSDWRLPSLAEAMSLMKHRQKQGSLYIDALFDNRQTGIWTVDTDKASRVWVAYYANGNCGHYQFGSLNFVRAVRSLSKEK